MLNAIERSPTTIIVNWMSVSGANGYVVYTNDMVHSVIGSTNTSSTVNDLIPGTNYSITVRAYQDILGPPSTTIDATTENGIITMILLLMLFSYSYNSCHNNTRLSHFSNDHNNRANV